MRRPYPHYLPHLLIIAVCVIVARAETWVDIAHNGRMKQAWLAMFLDLFHGVPSQHTF